MSSIAVPQTPALTEFIEVTRPAPTARCRPRRRWLGALLVAAALSPALLALPPVWHGTLRALLGWQAARCGYVLSVERISGGPFDLTRLGGVRLRQSGEVAETSGAGTDLTIGSAEFFVAWRLPWLHRSAPWLREVRFEGVRGVLDLASGGISRHRANYVASRCLPADFVFQADDFEVRRDGYRIRATGFLLSGRHEAAGEIEARELRADGPGFASVFNHWHGRTFWKDERLILSGLDLGQGILLSGGTIDASQLGRGRLGWDCHLSATGGETRVEGVIEFIHDRVTVDIAATVHRMALSPLARVLGLREPVDGLVEQASFTFRGDPQDLSSAQMSLSARATDFRWGDWCGQSLDTQAIVVNRRLHLHRFDLRQDGNRVSLAGEFPLPPDEFSRLAWIGKDSSWQAAGFSCNVDARLDNGDANYSLAR